MTITVASEPPPKASVACSGRSENGECVYLSDLHTQYDEAACEAEADEQNCETWELDDRSTVDQTVIACVYEDCAEEIDCEAFRDL